MQQFACTAKRKLGVANSYGKTYVLPRNKKSLPFMESLSLVYVEPTTIGFFRQYNLALICIKTQHNTTKIKKLLGYPPFKASYLNNLRTSF